MSIVWPSRTRTEVAAAVGSSASPPRRMPSDSVAWLNASWPAMVTAISSGVESAQSVSSP